MNMNGGEQPADLGKA